MNEGSNLLDDVASKIYCLPRHSMPFKSMNEGPNALDDVASNDFCSPRHTMPFKSTNEGLNALNDVASNMCLALPHGGDGVPHSGAVQAELPLCNFKAPGFNA